MAYPDPPDLNALNGIIADEKTQEEGGEMRKHEVSTGNVDIFNRLAAIRASIQSLQAQENAEHVQMNAGFDALQAKIDAQHDRMDARLDGVNAKLKGIVAGVNSLIGRLDAIEAKKDANKARAFNYSVVAGSTTMRFRSIVKYVGGHPLRAGLPHAVDKVVFEENYGIGDQPPYHLMPLNNGEINKWSRMKLTQLRRRLRSIYWFYNDDRLTLAANANRAACMNAILNVKAYLLDP
ncbi:hypothetical protein CASFOL_013484 [Castilleja foliolosa]|uniref:Uncharacterized protein n=1 Tax=Castilleja foliolosa TaxID=1961234 RepID=A0ABD3DP05_9LAMI